MLRRVEEEGGKRKFKNIFKKWSDTRPLGLMKSTTLKRYDFLGFW
jgi:hypothetical protein